MVAVIGDEESRAPSACTGASASSPSGILKGIGYKHGRWLSTVLMQRPLGRGMSEAADAADLLNPLPVCLRILGE